MANLTFAIQRLLSTYPLHGAIIAEWTPAEDTAISTMSVGISGAHARLRYNPDFLESLTLEECVGVLLHEVHHVLGEHCWMKQKDYPHRQALVIATEITANQYIREKLPGHPILLQDYPQLPADEDAHQRYRRLAEIIPPQQEVASLDVHDWEELQENETISRSVLGTSITRALKSLTDEQRSQCSHVELCQAAKLLQNARLSKNLARNKKAKLDWRRLLRNYVGQELARKLSFARPPRRFPNLLGVIPARTWCADKPTVLAIIDTSGSISDSMLSDISSELAVMQKTHSVVVAECDNMIRNVYPYKPITEVKGRGNTDLRPPLQAEFLRNVGADLAVYFTDGQGSAAEHSPSIPVIWCLTKGGKKPAAWVAAGQQNRARDVR